MSVELSSVLLNLNLVSMSVCRVGCRWSVSEKGRRRSSWHSYKMTFWPFQLVQIPSSSRWDMPDFHEGESRAVRTATKKTFQPLSKHSSADIKIMQFLKSHSSLVLRRKAADVSDFSVSGSAKFLTFCEGLEGWNGHNTLDMLLWWIRLQLRTVLILGQLVCCLSLKLETSLTSFCIASAEPWVLCMRYSV